MVFAIIRQAAEAASEGAGPLHGYPPWAVVLVGAGVAALLLWLFAKLLKWTIWIGIIVILVAGLVTAAKMYLGT